MTLSGRGEIGRQVSVLCVRRWRLTGSLAVRPLTWHGPVRCVIPLSRQDVGALNLRSLHCSGSSSGCAGQPTSPLRRNRPEPMKNRRAQTRRFARWSSTSVHAAQTREELAATARLDRWNKSKSESVDREKQPRHGGTGQVRQSILRMNIADIHLVLKNRAAADTGSGGLFNTTSPLISAWYPGRVPADGEYPYVVETTTGTPHRDAFGRDVVIVTFRASVWVPWKMHTDTDPMLTASRILARIYGNWSSSSPSTQPTYGFHRFKPTLASPWTSSYIIHETTIDESDDYYINLIPQFSFTMSN